MRGGGGKGSSALTIAFHSRGADLVEFLLRNGSDIDEMGVVSIEDDLEDLERTALHPVERRRKDILQMLLDHRADVYEKEYIGKTVMSRMGTNGNEVISSILTMNGGYWR